MVEHDRGNVDRAIGITAIMIGILVLIGEFLATPRTIAWLFPLLAAILLVVGILILANVLRSSNVAGIVFVVAGILLLVNLLGILWILGRVVDLVVGVVLLIVGVSKLR